MKAPKGESAVALLDEASDLRLADEEVAAVMDESVDTKEWLEGAEGTAQCSELEL
jgi:hypothetical protein